MPKFTVAKTEVDIDRADVLRALINGAPGLVQKHYIEVGGRQWPVKEALATVTGLETRHFTSQHASKVLSALGFDVLQRESPADPVESVRRDLEAVLRRIDALAGQPGTPGEQIDALIDLRNEVNRVIVLSRIAPAHRTLQAGER